MMQAPVQRLENPAAAAQGVELCLLRIDLLHEHFGGNKWFKLKYTIEAARDKNAKTLLTFGGAFSNHIAATAAAGKAAGLKTIGIIRGEASAVRNPTLQFAHEQGMELVYLDRESYRGKNDPAFLDILRRRFDDPFIIPEGGAASEGVKGCMEIVPPGAPFDTVCVACGTGATLAGIALSLGRGQRVIGFPVLKNGSFLEPEIKALIAAQPPQQEVGNWSLECDYHFGGYAKTTPALEQFVRDFKTGYGIPLDYIYTAKMVSGVFDLLEKGAFKKGERLLLVHTGGLQGNAGIEARLKSKAANR